MKRFLIILCCICLIVCLAAPALAAASYIDPVDYIVSESANGDNNYINVRVPVDVLTITWDKYKSGTWSNSQKGSSATFPADSTAFDIYTNISPAVDITSLVNGTTITMQYEVSNSGSAQPQASNGRWFFRYLDVDGNVIKDQITTINTSQDFNVSYISTTLDKPDNATQMVLYYQWLGVTAGSSFTVKVTGLRFSCLVSALQRVQQETGKTNKLLNEAINGDHGFDSSGSNFGSEADQLAGAGDQMNNAMGSGMNSLGSMTNSVAFTGTLTTLAGVMDAVFVGHEITICGVSANPFTLFVSIFAIAILLPLGLKFVFRKWGSGGG